MKRLFIITVCLMSMVAASYAQTVVGGTSFAQKENYADWGWDFSTTSHYGPSGNVLAANLTYLENGSSIQTGGHWVCVDNPFKLGTNTEDETSIYHDIADDMFVTNLTGTACTKLFSYTINGLAPGSAYTVTMRVYAVSKATPTKGYYGSLKVGTDLDQYMNVASGSGGGVKDVNFTMGQEGTAIDITWSGTLAATATSTVISLYEGYNMSANTVVGISDVSIKGVLNPKIISGQGSEMCRGEQTLLTLDRDYGNTTVTWEKSATGSSWSTVSTKASLYDEVTTAKMYYRATVGGVVTPSYEVTTVTCCETVVDGNTVYSSRETIFYEDFGYFTDAHDYVDAEGNTSTTASSIMPYRTDVNFTMPSTAGTFDATGQINDGYYGVVVPTPIGYCTDANCNSTATWMIGNGSITSDHTSMITGRPNSACLFMNVTNGFTGPIFSRTISGLCTGKALTFECFVGNMSGGTNPVITLTIEDAGGNILASKENVTVAGSSGWNRISIENFILTQPTIVVKVQSFGTDWEHGQDICFDDIKIMACSSPALDLFSDVANLERATTVCSDPFTLGSVASNLLTAFYGSTLKYRFQYTTTPNNENSWTTITTSSASTYPIPNPSQSSIFSGVSSGESVFFRVIAATEATLNSTTTFSQTNYCKNYSISPSVEAIYNCPSCQPPLNVVVTSTTSTNLCPGGSVELLASEQNDATTFSYAWYKGGETGTLVAGPTTGKTLSYTVPYDEADTYTVVVYDVNFPTLTSCKKTASKVVKAYPAPTVTITGGSTVCQGTTPTAVVYTFTGSQPFAFTYSNGTTSVDKTGLMANTYKPTLPTAVGSYTYTIGSFSDDYCPGATSTASASVVIKEKPNISLPTVSAVCEGTSVSLIASSTTTGVSYVWKKDGTTISGATSATYSLTSPTTASMSGTYSASTTKDACSSDPVSINVTVNPTPTITSLTASKDAVCSGTTITLTATTSDAQVGEFTWTTDETTSSITGSGAQVTLTKSVTSQETIVVTLNYKSASGCPAVSKTKTVTINPIPASPGVADLSYCLNATTAKQLTATASAGCTLQWYGTNVTGGTASTTAPTPLTTAVGDTKYYVSQKNAGGCESVRGVINVKINDKLSPEITIGDVELCIGEATTVATSQSYEKTTWTGTATANFDDVSLASPNYTAPSVSAKTDYTVTVTVEDINGCTGTSDKTISVYPTPTVTLSTPSAVCSGKTSTVTATVTSVPSTGGSHTWSANVTEVSATSATYSGASTGEVTYDYMSSVGCKAVQKKTTVAINPIPAAPTTSAVSYCRNTTSKSLSNQVTASTGTLQWYGTDATGGSSSTTAPTPSTATVATTTYYVSQTVDGCESVRSSIVVTINDTLSPTITLSDDSVCVGTAVTIGLGATTYKTVSWTESGASKLNSTTIQDPVFSGTAVAGTYALKVSVTDNNGCSGSARDTITVNAVPTATLLVPNNKHCISETGAQTITATITPATLTGTGTWTVATKVSETTATFVPSAFAKGTHTVTYNFESSAGCKAAEVTQDMIVDALPTPTVEVSNNNVCVSGTNSSEVTVKTTGTVTTGTTFAYAINNGGTINTTTGAFDPTKNAAGTYTITLTYTDANGCVGTAEDDIKVNALPVVTLTNQTEICYNGAAINIGLTATPTGGTGTWTGTTSASSAQFDPKAVTAGEKTITYTYKDLNGCTNSDTRKITVVKVDAPVVASAYQPKTVVKNGGLLSGTTELVAAKSTASDQLQWTAATPESWLDGVETYQTGLTASNPAATYPYLVREYRLVNGANCYSASTSAKLVISDCEALAPESSDIYICVGDATKSSELTATKNASSTVTPYHLSWMSIDPVGKTGALSELVFGSDNVNSLVYIPTVDRSVAGETSFYAAEYDKDNGCWSAGKLVTIHVVENPVVTILSPADTCAKGTETVPVTVTPQNGTLTATTGTLSGFNWLPGDYSGASESATFTYVVESEPYADNTTCSTTKTSSTTAHFMEKPTTSDKSWLIGNIAGIPANYMEGTLTSDGVSMTWYEEVSLATDLGTGTTYTPDRAALQTAATGLTQYEKTYYVTQTNGNGCESEAVPAKLTLIDCPWEAPIVTGDEKCEDETLLDLKGTEGASVATGAIGGAVTQWLWYDETGALLDNTYTVANYAHGVDETTAGTTNFLVSYKAKEIASGDECESPKTAVSVKVNAKPEITITPMSTLCYAGGKKIAEAMVDGVSSKTLTGGTWSIVGQTSGINAMTGEIDPTFAGKTDASYTIKYVYTNAKNCTEENTASITIEYPEIPTTTDYSGIITDPKTVELTAGNIETSATSVNWYETTVSTPALSTNNPWSTSDDPEKEVTKSYYVSQTVDGCESERAEQRVNITNCPWKAPTVVAQAACSGKALSAMSATPESGITPMTWKWYDSSKSPITNNASTYTQTNNTTAGVTTYYVSYTASGAASNGFECESQKAAVTSTVYSLPTIDITPMTVCYGAGSARVEVVTETPGNDGKGTSNGVGSGVWTTTGETSAISTLGIFNTKANGEQSGTYEVTYTYTDGKGCVNSDKANVEVIYLATPEVTGFYAMTTQKNAVEVNVTSTVETGATIEWFGSAATTTGKLGTGATWLTGDSYSAITNKTYYARQHKGACFSDPAGAAVVKIVDCPIPTVTIADDEACNYEVVPTLQAESGSWSERDGAKSTFKFYQNNTVVGTSTDGAYQPSTITDAGLYTYMVSEYNSEPLQNLTNPEGCESTPVKVTINYIETEAPNIKSGLSAVCYGEENPTFTASASSAQVSWYTENPGTSGAPTTALEGTGTSYRPKLTDEGEHTIWAIKYENGCYSTRSSLNFTIRPIPAAPTTTSVAICSGETNSQSLTASGEATAYFNWYADDAKDVKLVTDSKGWLPSDTQIGSHLYYATQVVGDCESPVSEAVFTIKQLPSAPVVNNQKNLCAYDAVPTLQVIGTDIQWYAADKTTIIGSGTSYDATDMTVGSKKYYASQTVEGCEGSKALISFSIFAKPTSPTVIGARVCEGDSVIPSLTTQLPTDEWYADEALTTYLATGHTYKPDYSMLGNSSKTYYVIRKQNGCVSNTMPGVLEVIPKPNFTIGNDTIFCVYDSVLNIQASGFEPAITTTSFINWSLVNTQTGEVNKYVDTEEHSIAPIEVFSTAGEYMVNATYTYRQDAVMCKSETKEISCKIIDRARMPIVFSKVICQGEDINELQALGTPNIVWESLSGTLPIICNGQKYQFQSGQMLDIGTYYFRIYDVNMYDQENGKGCMSIADTVSMTVAPAAKTKLFGVDSVCVGETESYYTQYTQGSQYLWNVTGGHLNYAKTDATSVRYVDWTKSGIDTLTVFEQTWAGCEGYDTLVVKIAPKPIPMFTWTMPGSSNIIELTDSTIQDSLWYVNVDGERIGEQVPYSMKWNFGHQGESETDVDTVLQYNHRNRPILEGNYLFGYNCPILTVTNNFGCSEKYTECIYVNIATSLFIPNAFSPTNPAESVRTFQPKGFNLMKCEIAVYDKWGNLIWFSDEVENGAFVGSWDGRYDGKMMKSDVYIWKMEATFLDGQEWEGFDAGNGKKSKFGSVTLIR